MSEQSWNILSIKSRWLRVPAGLLLLMVYMALAFVFLPLMMLAEGARGASEGFSEWRSIVAFRRTFRKVAKAFGAA